MLELAEELGLTDAQLQQTKELFRQMKQEAIAVGQEILSKEKALDALFSSGDVSAAEVDSALVEIGILNGKLRAVHVTTHLTMKSILSPKQVSQYDALRGYDEGGTTHGYH